MVNQAIIERRIRYRKSHPYSDSFLCDLESSPQKEDVLNGKIGTKDKISFLCNEHGLYRQTIECHLAGQGCPKCKSKKQGVTFRKNYRDVNVYPKDFLDSIAYDEEREQVESFEIGVNDKIHFLCERHGIYYATVKSQLKGRKCKLCSAEYSGDKFSLTKRSRRPFPKWFVDSLEGSPDKDAILSCEKRTYEKALFYCKTHGLYEQSIANRLHFRRECPKCRNGNHKSNVEDCLYDELCRIFCKSTIIRSDRKTVKNPLSGSFMELDILIPDIGVAIEVDGLYWHSFENLKRKNVFRPERFHKLKTDLCREKGIMLIHFFDDELLNKMDVCVDVVKRLAGLEKNIIDANKCVIKEIESDESKDFFELNSLAVFSDGRSYGLFDGSDMVFCAVVDSNNIKFVEKIGVRVVGGIEKITNFVKKELSLSEVFCYGDVRLSEDVAFEREGWIKVKDVDVDYQYITNGVRTDKKVNGGLYKIFDCGKVVFKK